MYLDAVHAETFIPTLRQLIKAYPLGILTTAIPSKHYPTILSSHIPFVLDVHDDTSPTELGVLRCHIARQNPQAKSMIESLETQGKPSGDFLEEEITVLFTSPVHHYVTPKFYTETKASNGKVVPTWNYAAVQAYGRAEIFFDSKSPDTGAFLSKQTRDLSQHGEESIMGYDGENGRKEAWTLDEAPERYVELLQKAIIGIEITIERLEGKFKMSQEMGLGDREGVAKGFAEMKGDIGEKMAEIVRERSQMKTAAKA